MSEKLLLTHGCAPGDIVCMTALPRDIHAAYPGRYEIHVATHCSPLWKHNPHVESFQNLHKISRGAFSGVRRLKLDYGWCIKHADKQKLHFITAFHRDLQRQIHLRVPCLQPKGDLYLKEQHNTQAPIAGRYWIAVAGGKSDFTTKLWSTRRWQQVVNQLSDNGVQIVQCGATHKGHQQPSLSGVLNMVGETDLREFLWLIKHADGIICPITFAMHAAATFDKPCVCIAGGREHWWWEAYVNVRGIQNFGTESKSVEVPHRYLHTQGLLDCCKQRGCWRNKVLRKQMNYHLDKRKSHCHQPTPDEFGQIIPRCLDMISANHVTRAVMSYYEDGTLPPIGDEKLIVLPQNKLIKDVVASNARIDLFAPVEQLIQQEAPIAVPLVQLKIPQLLHTFKSINKAQPKITQKKDVFDDPIIGGRFTICILMYGDYPDMHKSCLQSILQTVPATRCQIRVATNAICPASRAWLDSMQKDGHIHLLYHNDHNKKKYPVMREMFHDPMNPIEDQWILWFDDDTIANVDQQWCVKLCKVIKAKYAEKYRMFGAMHFWSLSPSQRAWAASRPWYHKRLWQTSRGQEAPNGDKVHFAAGGFWALETAIMRQAGIPDETLGHNGGDYMLSAQVWQAGYKTYGWNNRKQFVNTSSVPRRGLDEVHTGMNGWQIGGVPKRR